MVATIRSQNPIPGHAYIHGVYVHNKERDTCGIVANVKNVETGESILHVCKEPQYPFWVTKQGLRTHTDKKEYAPIVELDRFIAPIHRFPEAIMRALGERPGGYINPKRVNDSPYVYGCDISPTVLMKYVYRKACAKLPIVYNVGALDIEQDVTGSNEINAISYVDGKTHKVFCGGLKRFMKGKDEAELHRLYEKHKREVFDKITNKIARASFEKLPYTVEFKVFDDEVDMITWCFRKMHECKPDFCAVWNEGFDIPTIMDRLKFRNVDIRDVFCHPDVPRELRYVRFVPGKIKPGQHITDKWDWLHCAGYTQFYDAMCLYGRLRKALERESKYTLDAVMEKVLGSGKMEFGDYVTHWDMQTYAFPKYCVYNVFDSILTQLSDEATTDVRNMLNLSAGSDLSDFDKQTVQLKNKFYEYCLVKNCVPSSVGNNLLKDYDRLIVNVGGGVLDPKYARNVGMNILEEEDRETNMLAYVEDIDVGSSYPMNLASRNISRETKIATVLTIAGKPNTDVGHIFEMVIDVDENVVKLMSTHFGLPDYHTIQQEAIRWQQQQAV